MKPTIRSLLLAALCGAFVAAAAGADDNASNRAESVPIHPGQQPPQKGASRAEDPVVTGKTLDRAGYGDVKSPVGVGSMGMSEDAAGNDSMNRAGKKGQETPQTRKAKHRRRQHKLPANAANPPAQSTTAPSGTEAPPAPESAPPSAPSGQ